MSRAWPLLCLLLSACEAFDPDLGPEREGGGDDVCDLGDSDPGTKVTYAELRDQVLRPNCSCHVTPGGLGRIVGGLDLDDFDALRAGGRHEGTVVPGDPCGSIIVQKTGGAPPFGSRMPLNGAPLPADARQRIVDWIAEGANR